jgi:hypothetical protein
MADQRFYILNFEHQSYAWIAAKFYHHGVTQQSHHRMGNRDVVRYQSCGLMNQDLGPWHCADNPQPTNV